LIGVCGEQRSARERWRNRRAPFPKRSSAA